MEKISHGMGMAKTSLRVGGFVSMKVNGAEDGMGVKPAKNRIGIQRDGDGMGATAVIGMWFRRDGMGADTTVMGLKTEGIEMQLKKAGVGMDSTAAGFEVISTATGMELEPMATEIELEPVATEMEVEPAVTGMQVKYLVQQQRSLRNYRLLFFMLYFK